MLPKEGVMPKIRVNTNFMIIGTAACLLALPVLSEAVAQSMMPVDTYGAAPYQSAPAHSLGTLHQDDMGSQPVGSQYGHTAPGTYNQSSSDDVLQPTQAGDITYVTGGIGDEERAALHDTAKDYNLRVMSASHDGAFMGDTHIMLYNHKGDVLLDANAGPLFFAKMPAGSYRLEATHDGVVKKQAFTIKGNKPALVHLGW
jgi:hypothetical protein